MVATILVLFVGNQNVHLKLVQQNWRQFRRHYASGPTITVGVTCTYGPGMGQDMSLRAAAPAPPR